MKTFSPKFLLALVAALALSATAFAHGNMEHVMGTVTEITDHSISVRLADGSIEIVAFDATTKFLKGDAAATVKDVTVGARVVIHAQKHDDKLHAAEVKIGVTMKPAAHVPETK